jgi:hypothetical protein
MLETARAGRDKDVAERLSSVELTERMSGAKLRSWSARMPGKRSRAALVAVATVRHSVLSRRRKFLPQRLWTRPHGD